MNFTRLQPEHMHLSATTAHYCTLHQPNRKRRRSKEKQCERLTGFRHHTRA